MSTTRIRAADLSTKYLLWALKDNSRGSVCEEDSREMQVPLTAANAENTQEDRHGNTS